MNVVKDEVLQLVKKEYDNANKVYGPIHSMHEGYAVLLEELEETEECIRYAKTNSNYMWSFIRANKLECTEYQAECLMKNALNTACESIQVAAVCNRIIDFCKEKEHGKE